MTKKPTHDARAATDGTTSRDAIPPMTSEQRQRAAYDRKNARRRAKTAARHGKAVTLPDPVKNGPPFLEVTPFQLGQVEAAAGYGLTVKMIARLIFKCTDTTFRAICARDARVVDAFESGHAKVGFKIGEALVNKAKAGDVQAIRYYEATRQGRRDTIDVSVSGPGGGPIPYEDVSLLDEGERMRRIKAVLQLGLQRRDDQQVI